MAMIEDPSLFPSNGYVDVYPFARQQDGEEIVIGRVGSNDFYSLSVDAVELLDLLAAGKNIEEAQKLYRIKYGETPDVQGFLEGLAAGGLVRPRSAESCSPLLLEPFAETPASTPQLAFIGRSCARKIFGPWSWALFALVTSLSLLTIALDPGIVPGREALYFNQSATLKTLLLMSLGYTSVFIHEMGHMLAARAVGVESRIGIGHRLWVLVAETDMTGLWAVPRRSRIIPILAGPLIDIGSAGLLILFLSAARRSWIALPLTCVEIMRALVYLYLLRLLWQFFFFVRTDIYFLIATLFGCKSLMRDTRIFLHNVGARLLGRATRVDQSYLTGSERGVVRCYSVFWLVGRALAFASLFFVTIPVAFHFVVLFVKGMTVGTSGGLYKLIDATVMALFTLLPLVIGIFLWLRSLILKRDDLS